MKKNYKAYIAGGVLAAVLGITAQTADAMEMRDVRDSSGNNRAAVFCNRFAEVDSNAAKHMAEQETRLEKARSDRTAKLIKDWTERDTKLSESRTDSDTKRTADYERLLGIADTDGKKRAVEAFKTAVDNAVKARRTAVDNAIKTFRIGMDKVISDHKIAVDRVLTTFKTSVDRAVAKAQADCAAGKDSTTVRREFTASLKAAKEKFRTDRSAIRNTGPQITNLIRTRNASIDNAFKTFRTTVERAKTTLRAAFK